MMLYRNSRTYAEIRTIQNTFFNIYTVSEIIVLCIVIDLNIKLTAFYLY